MSCVADARRPAMPPAIADGLRGRVVTRRGVAGMAAAGLVAIALAVLGAWLASMPGVSHVVASRSGDFSHARAVHRAAAAPRQSLADLPASARGPVSAAIGASNREYRLVGLRGANPAQRLRLAFTPAGATVASARGHVELSAIGFGRRDALTPVAATRPHARRNRVSYRSGSLRTWYANGPLGLEQGFTVTRRPVGGAGPLAVVLSVSGNLRPRLGAGGMVLSGAGVRLRYDGLSAVDARGHRLRSWLSLRGRRLAIEVDDRRAAFPVRIDPFVQQGTKVIGSGADDSCGCVEQGFGLAVSQDGHTAVVGGPSDNDGAGAVWVFTRSGQTWTQQGPKLIPTDATPSDMVGFGNSVGLSADGNTALIGSANITIPGSVWVFTRSGYTWTQQGSKITPADGGGFADFGGRVALSADGNTALVDGFSTPSSQEGQVWVFVRSGQTWTEQGGGPLTGAGGTGQVGEDFGIGLALSADGSTALIGGNNDNQGDGAAWVFTRSGQTWTPQGPKLTGPGEVGAGGFGGAVALSADGNTALIGAPFDSNGSGTRLGAAWVFTRSGQTWTPQGPKLVPSDGGRPGFGHSVALSSDGNTALIGGPFDRENGIQRGAAWEFTRTGQTWTQQSPLFTASDADEFAEFGWQVGLSGDGDTAMIAGPTDGNNLGAVWAYARRQPAVTSPARALFTIGRPGAFTIASTGIPASSLSEAGALPAGVSFTADQDGTATLAGTPAAGTVGAYPLRITATNGNAPDAVQQFVLVVGRPPSISSGARATFTAGQPSSFRITTTGFPVSSLSEAGALPAGVTFTDAGNGTATLAGTPAAGSGGDYPVTITATNGASPAAAQQFILNVQAPPTVSLITPPEGAHYLRRQKPTAVYSCAEGAGGSGLASCSGTVADGARVDTAKAGTHSFTVTATSTDGLHASVTHTYTVALSSNRFSVSHIRGRPNGTVRFRIRTQGRGRINVMLTAWNDNLAAAAVTMHPARNRFVYARAHVRARRGGAVRLAVAPNRRGRRLVAHHRYRVTLRLWVSFTPVGGVRRTRGFYGLHLQP